MNAHIIAALTVAAVLPLTAVSAKAEHGSCLGEPTCRSTQLLWESATEADKHTSAYAHVLDAEQSASSSLYWQHQEALARTQTEATAPTAGAENRHRYK
jgi:hypothetical protein